MLNTWLKKYPNKICMQRLAGSFTGRIARTTGLATYASTTMPRPEITIQGAPDFTDTMHYRSPSRLGGETRRLIPRVLNQYITAIFCFAIFFGASASHAEQVVVYSARIEQLIKPMFDAFTKDTGINVKFVTDKEGPLLARLKAEGKNTPADMLITSDAGNLWEAAQEGLLRPVESKMLQENVPAYLHDPRNQWFGLSVRARTIIYNTQKVKPSDLSTYEALAEPQWKGRLCLRTSKKVYNQSLVAMMIAEHGAVRTEEIIKGWVANLAIDPLSDETKAMEFVAAGRCDVTIANSYYYGRLMQKNPALPLAIFWPNQEGSGVHVNISGAGITKYAHNVPAATRLLEFLSSEKAQNLFADVNMEYPVNPRVKPDPTVAAWGTFKQNTINVTTAGELQAEAVKLMDRAGYR
ncbi:iron(III) transport system substrate-binding protein [Nitrosospira sp. Nsp1]|nr:iron(III) transport system substrate-binding protein [Nitrosospira sp. Nsp1]